MLIEILYQSARGRTLTVAERQPESISMSSCAVQVSLQMHNVKSEPHSKHRFARGQTQKDIAHSHIHRAYWGQAQINKLIDAQSAETNWINWSSHKHAHNKPCCRYTHTLCLWAPKALFSLSRPAVECNATSVTPDSCYYWSIHYLRNKIMPGPLCSPSWLPLSNKQQAGSWCNW